MQIDLLRHGELEGKKSYCGITDTKLTNHGWQQMLQACQRRNEWQTIISSPLSRCANFAEYLSAQLKLPLRIDSRWQEMNFGRWDGLTALEVMTFDEKELHRFWQNPTLSSPPGGESLKEMQKRVLQAWQELVLQGQSSLVITHGGPMRIMHCHLENYPIERLLDVDVQYAEMRCITLSPSGTERHS